MGKINSTKKNLYTLYYQWTIDMVTMIIDHYIFTRHCDFQSSIYYYITNVQRN